MNPILVEVTRADRVESFHRGAAVVVDAVGDVVFSNGNVDHAIYPRSAAKPLQALPLVASGAAEKLALTDAEIALACGSHGGEPVHVATAEQMLRKTGHDGSCLECGSHWPLDESAARALSASGQRPSALHNNCSGKHAGFICLACFHGLDPAGYAQPDHPIMREVTATLALMTDTTLDESCRGIDGCSIPTFAMPLRALALGFARLGTGAGLPPSLTRAAERIRTAIVAEPLMIAGAGKFDTSIAAGLRGAVLSKCGAEGTAAATIPALGLGIAVKIDDGASRAVEAAMAALLHRFLPSPLNNHSDVLASLDLPIRNWHSTEVGRLRAV